MPAPAGFVGFTASGNFPDLSTIYFPPQGTLITFDILYGDGSDAYVNHIFKLFDAVTFLKGQVSPTKNASYTRLSSTPATWFSAADWQPGLATAGNAYTANTTTAGRLLWFLLGDDCLPNGQTLNSVSVKITGSPTDANLPAGLPQLLIYKKDAAGAITQLGSTTTDSSALLADYQAQHTLTVSSLATTVDRSQFIYFAAIVPEHNTDATTGMVVQFPSVTWTATSAALF